MKTRYINKLTPRDSKADQRLLINAITLIALGLSILFLNSWDTLFVRTSVGLFWGAFMLILNWPDLVQTVRHFKRKHERQRQRSFTSSV